MCLGLYLAAGEALTNAVKHSRCTEITLFLTVDTATVRVLVQDNGIGGVRQVPRSIAGRVEDLHGTVQVESRSGLRHHSPGHGAAHNGRCAMNPRLLAIAAAWVAAVTATVAGWVIFVESGRLPEYSGGQPIFFTVATLSAPVLGTVVLRRHPREWTGPAVVRRGDHRDAVRVADSGARCPVPADRGDRAGDRLATRRGRGPPPRATSIPRHRADDLVVLVAIRRWGAGRRSGCDGRRVGTPIVVVHPGTRPGHRCGHRLADRLLGGGGGRGRSVLRCSPCPGTGRCRAVVEPR